MMALCSIILRRRQPPSPSMRWKARQVVFQMGKGSAAAASNKNEGLLPIAFASTDKFDAPSNHYALGLGAVASAVILARCYHSTVACCEDANNSNQNKRSSDNDSKSADSFFDMAQQWASDFDHLLSSSLPKSSTPTKEDAKRDELDKQPTSGDDSSTTDTSSSIFSDFLSFANNASLFTRKPSTPPPDIDELIQQAQRIANHNQSNDSTSSSNLYSSSGFLSQVLYFQQNAKAIQDAFESSFGPYLSNMDIGDLFHSVPTAALHYYLEYEDSIKTPSWKRRIHRFQRDVEVTKVGELNEALILSELSYADSVEEIRAGLERLYDGKDDKPQWELLFCDTESRPNQPSHFLAIQKNASPYDDALHVLMVVRGTKSMSDLITDAMLEATDYEYALPGEDEVVIQGKVHSGMVQSGTYLVEQHQKLLSTLLKLSNKHKLEISLIGHSLGAGAATVAAMEWNSNNRSNSGSSKDDVQISAHVIGFGCPALLSRPLSLATKEYVTTVIADADIIPRMSGATLVNLLLDVRSFDYRNQAERDVEQALRELQSHFSDSSNPLSSAKSKSKLGFFNIDEEDIQSVMGYVHSGLEKVVGSSSSDSEKEPDDKTQEEANIEKIKPVLFPPGACIHFYRDGSGISGTYVPCNFFQEIDVAWTMIEDHLISSGYRKIFLSLMRDFHKDDHFSFESKDGVGK